MQTTDFGTITDNADVSICVTHGGLKPPGDIFGTVFDPVSKIPLNRVQVTLITASGELEDITGRNGVYRFNNVSSGTVTFSVCKRPFAAFDCILEEVEYKGGPLNKNFELIRRIISDN